MEPDPATPGWRKLTMFSFRGKDPEAWWWDMVRDCRSQLALFCRGLSFYAFSPFVDGNSLANTYSPSRRYVSSQMTPVWGVPARCKVFLRQIRLTYFRTVRNWFVTSAGYCPLCHCVSLCLHRNRAQSRIRDVGDFLHQVREKNYMWLHCFLKEQGRRGGVGQQEQ